MASTESVLAVIRASRPELRSSHDRAAFALHAAFVSKGYLLGAVGSAEISSSGQEVGIEGWNQQENSYAFKYFTDQENLIQRVDVNCAVIEDKLMVDAALEDSADLLHMGIRVPDFAKDDSSGNYSQQYKNLDGLVKSLNTNILSKCSKKPPEPAPTLETGKSKIDDSRQGPMARKPGRAGVSVFGKPLGFTDLLPGPGAGVFEPGKTFESGEAGNLVGPRHPAWGGDASIYQGPGRGLHPPGARHDPFGPPGVPGFEPQRFGRGGGRGDLQHFPG